MLKILAKSKDPFIALQAVRLLIGKDYDSVLPGIEKFIENMAKPSSTLIRNSFKVGK
jgi:hypothetical protein